MGGAMTKKQERKKRGVSATHRQQVETEFRKWLKEHPNAPLKKQVKNFDRIADDLIGK